MAEAIKREYDIVVLKVQAGVGLGASAGSRESLVRFTLQYHEQAALVDGPRWEFLLSQIVPLELDRGMTRGQGPQLGLPASMLEPLRDWFAAKTEGKRPLWVHLVKPYGLLRIVPWELLLGEALERPILMLPDFIFPPPRQAMHVLDVALCGSAPLGYEGHSVLLLPAVLIRVDRSWTGAERFRDAFRDVVKVVTAFTLAHSITLSLAALDVVQLPSRWIESAIAASVILAALNNLVVMAGASRWLFAFAFGLIHGFGFASVLADLGLPHNALLLALVGFSVGVGLGQLAVVTVFLPLAWALRNQWIYRQGILAGGSLLVIALASVWLIERAFDLKLVV